MPRLSRISSEGNFFHIMSQGINKNFIFKEETEINKYIYIMYDLKEEYHIEIIAYCIMSNHAHLLLKINSIEELSSYMHKLNARFAQYYNKKNNRVGFVFRNRFKSEAIRDEKHLYNCISYIFYNPVKARICARPEEYKYSNYKTYKNKQYLIGNTLDNNFIEVYENSDEKCEIIVRNFLKEKGITISNVMEDIELTEELVSYLHSHNISLRCMERVLKISRRKIIECYDNYLKSPK